MSAMPLPNSFVSAAQLLCGRRLQGVQKVSKYYHPFGTYHFILGAEIRTPPGSATAQSCSGAC